MESQRRPAAATEKRFQVWMRTTSLELHQAVSLFRLLSPAITAACITLGRPGVNSVKFQELPKTCEFIDCLSLSIPPGRCISTRMARQHQRKITI